MSAITTPKKRGRKPGTGTTITTDEVRAFWMIFHAHQGRAVEMKQKGATDREIELMMTPLAFHALNVLVGKAENLPEVKRYRLTQLERREPNILRKEAAARLGITRQAQLARRKNLDK